MRTLLVVIALAGSVQATESPQFRRQLIEACDQHTDKGRHKQALACITKLEKSASSKELRFLFYSRVTSLIAQNKLDEAQTLIADRITAMKGDPGGEEIWLHNASNWVAWGRGDLPRAVAETEGMRESASRVQLPPPQMRGAMLHYLWDRAYLLLDLALAQSPVQAAALATAEAARQDYHKVADPVAEADGLAVLDAYFALRQGRGKEAMAHVAKVERGPNGDLQDQYIVALALEAGGDKKGAAAVRKIIRTSKNVYPMKALIVRQLPLDQKKSPIGAPAPAN